MMTMTIRQSQIFPGRTGALYANGTSPIADFMRNYGRYLGGDSAGFAGATFGNNGTTHSWVADAGGGANYLGVWSAASGAFPTARPDLSPIVEGDTWRVSVAGTVDGQAFAAGHLLAALVNTPGTTYAGNWILAYSLHYGETNGRDVLTTSTMPIAMMRGTKATQGAAAGFHIAGMLIAINDSGNIGTNTEGLYVDAQRTLAGSGYTTAAEFQITEKVGDIASFVTPYAKERGSTFGMIIGSGGGAEVNTVKHPASAALLIDGNGGNFKSGIVLENDAIASRADGLKRAFQVGPNAALAWSGATDFEAMVLVSTITTPENAQQMRFNDVGITFLNNVGHPFLTVNNGPNNVAVNYLDIRSAAAGANPRLSWNGVDAVTINIAGLPTSATGLDAGDLWKDGSGFLKVA